jgi:chemotaxis response regulator CheB
MGIYFLHQPQGANMFQVVVQSAMRQLKSKLRLPAPPLQSTETDKKSAPKDRTGLILILMIGGGILLMAMFSNLPTN